MPRRSKSQTTGVVFDTVIIRFTRQIYYAQDESAFQLQVRQSPRPLPGGAFQADIEHQLQAFQTLFAQRLAMGQFFSRFTMTPEAPAALQTISDLGQALYALLPLSFRRSFPQLVQDVFEKGHGLRLVLEASAGDKADRLLSLPWELLFFENTGAFLARSPRVLVVRRLLEAVRRGPVPMKPPFHLLHVIAHSAAAPQAYGIDEGLRKVEKAKIPRAILPGEYNLVEKPGSIEQMLAALREHPYHIVHFLGHGEVLDEAKDSPLSVRSHLRFVDDEDQSQWVTGEYLQHVLELAPTVQLLVLNACHGGANVVRSVALDLVYHGLPYVVAIQGDILQDAAQPFIEAFYEALQGGSAIERAVAVGRAAIATAMPQSIDWCLPVLYTNVGLEASPAPREYADRLWSWMSHPQARQRLGMGNLIFGSLHCIAAALLLLSEQTISLWPQTTANWITGLSLAFPLLMMISTPRLNHPEGSGLWSPSAKLSLWAHTLGSAALGFGLPLFYAWLLMLLLMATGFADRLNTVARALLTALTFAPGVWMGWWLAYSQALGHARSLISRAQIEPPVFTLGEVSILLGGYALLVFPWLVRKFAPGFLAQPWSLLWAGVLLVALGYALLKSEE